MATYEVGQTLVFGLKTYDTAGALADVGALPTATLTKPDGSTASGSVTKTATGTYTATYTASAVGRWRCAWAGSGANSGGLPYTDVADVADLSRLIIPLAEARAALNLPAAAVANDDELRGYIAAATTVIEGKIGPVLATTKTETHDGGNRYAIALFEYPTAITEVTVDGSAVTDYCLGGAGVLWRGSRPGGGVWPNGAGNVVITYTVGAAAIPPNVLLAARELVRFLYQLGQQGNRPQLGESPTDYGPTVAGYAVPNRVVELLTPSMGGRVPGIA